MKPLGIVLGLAAIALLCTGIITSYNSSVAQASRIGPGWFQAVSMYGGMALLLMGMVVSIASAQAGAGWFGLAEPRGLHLGRKTLRVGALLLVVGLLLPVLMFLHLVPAPLVPVLVLALVTLKLPPILVAIGAVLLGSSAVALHDEVSHPLRILTLGKATLGTGFVLLLLGWSLPGVLQSVDRAGLGFFGFIMCMGCIPAGTALLILGALIMAAERSPHRDREAVNSPEPSLDPA
jgi:hypothetical protein